MEKCMKYFGDKKILKTGLMLLVFVFVMVFSGCNLWYKTNGLPVEDIDMTPRLVSVQGAGGVSDIVKNVSPAIVGIYSKLSRGSAVGSGVAIRNGGYILTNQHVIADTRGLTLFLADKTTVSADVLWQDSSIDMAIIKAAQNLPYLDCETTLPSVGDDVLAIGTPLSIAFQHTVTKGIVSALNRTLQVENENGTTTYMQDLIQHDASINPGNSGGPIINMSGKVVGINTLKAADSEGLGFAIPISTGVVIAKRLEADNAFTAPTVSINAIQTQFANYEEIKTDKTGLFVIDNSHKSFKQNDVLYKIDKVNINSMTDLKNYIYSKSVGDEIEIFVYRDNKKTNFKYVLK